MNNIIYPENNIMVKTVKKNTAEEVWRHIYMVRENIQSHKGISQNEWQYNAKGILRICVRGEFSSAPDIFNFIFLKNVGASLENYLSPWP